MRIVFSSTVMDQFLAANFPKPLVVFGSAAFSSSRTAAISEAGAQAAFAHNSRIRSSNRREGTA
jgi:hypothetical protein